MITFKNTTTFDTYNKARQAAHISFEYIPATDKTRCFITVNHHTYNVATPGKNEYCMQHESYEGSFGCWFRVDGDNIEILKGTHNGRDEYADKYLKKYMQVVTTIHSCIKYDKVIECVS